MKENPERRMFGGQERLTGKPRNLTLRSEGNPMAENQEQPQLPPEKPTEGNPPEKNIPNEPSKSLSNQEAAKIWNKLNPSYPWERLPLDIRNAFRAGENPGPGSPRGDPGEAEAEEAAEEALRRMLGREDVERGGYISKEKKIELLTNRETREKYFNDFFALIDASPHQFFEELFRSNWIRAQRYDEFIEALSRGAIDDLESINLTLDDLKWSGKTPDEIKLLRDELRGDLIRYQTERRMRERLHDVNAILYLPSVNAKQLFDSMQQFGSDLGDAALKTRGVIQMMDIYAQVLREDMANNGGYLRPEAVLGEVHTKEIDVVENGKPVKRKVITDVTRARVEEEAKKRFKELDAANRIVSSGNNGQPFVETDFKEWEVDKVFTLARGMLIMEERLITLAAESKLPKKGGQYTSLFLQDVIQSFSPFVHLSGKYRLITPALFAYMYKDKRVKKILGLMPWNPNELKETKKKYDDNPLSVLDSKTDLFYIQRLNPNRAGDMFTHLSWRVTQEPDVVSSVEKFIEGGGRRMITRLDKKPTKKANGETLTHEDYLKEYSNWIGTGIRFEKLRGDLSKLRTPESWDESTSAERKKLWEELMQGKREHIKEDLRKSMGQAETILGQMARLQPHRLYLKSEYIRARVIASVGKDFGFRINDEARLLDSQKERIDKALWNISKVERAMLSDRERLLDEGKTFDTISLDEFFDKVIQNDAEREDARRITKAVADDFDQNKDQYLDEFIFKREYRHGFVLWAEDSPLNEFNFTELGPTAAFARRARDNQAQAEAGSAELEMLGALKHVNNPEDLVKPIEKIFEAISRYDADKARASIEEKLEGLLKFYSSDWGKNIPVVGALRQQFGETSFARMVFGKNAPSWGSVQIRDIITEFEDKTFISKEGADRLRDKLIAGKVDVAVETGVTYAQLLALAFLFYMLSRIQKEK